MRNVRAVAPVTTSPGITTLAPVPTKARVEEGCEATAIGLDLVGFDESDAAAAIGRRRRGRCSRRARGAMSTALSALPAANANAPACVAAVAMSAAFTAVPQPVLAAITCEPLNNVRWDARAKRRSQTR